MSDEVEKIIDEALEGDPRAHELAGMISALEARREAFALERDSEADPACRKALLKRTRAIDEQIRILREEHAIAHFVENSIRMSVNRPRMDWDMDELE